MITELAKELSRIAKNEPFLRDAKRLSDLLFDELVDNCSPSEKEFSDLLGGTVITPHIMYRLVFEAQHKWKK